jgi:hypothetical protein
MKTHPSQPSIRDKKGKPGAQDTEREQDADPESQAVFWRGLSGLRFCVWSTRPALPIVPSPPPSLLHWRNRTRPLLPLPLYPAVSCSFSPKSLELICLLPILTTVDKRKTEKISPLLAIKEKRVEVEVEKIIIIDELIG